jgi:hypothetical protein
MDRPLPLLPLVLDRVPTGLRQALAQEGLPARSRIAGHVEGRFVLFDSKIDPAPWLSPGQVAIDVDRFRHRGFDPWQTLADERADPHRWQVGDQSLVEEIARVDKRAVRDAALAELREELEGQGGVWIRVAAFPFPYRSAFNFRVDYDQFEPEGFRAMLAAAEAHADCTSHFVNGAAFHRHPKAVKRLRGLDVGSHGFWHHVYRTEDENVRNLRRGIEVLRAARIAPAGFVAPHGRFNQALLAAMDDLGITHSSEFGLAYDELPFFPEPTGVLQIPIHPVCLELFFEAARRGRMQPRTGEDPARTEQLMTQALEYFVEMAREKYRAAEPMFFYGHPWSPPRSSSRVLAVLANAVTGLGAVWRTTLSEYGAWWRVRAGVRLSVHRDGEEYLVSADGMPVEYAIAVEYCRGRLVAPMPVEGPLLRFSPAALAYETRSPATAFRPVRVDRAHGLRAHFKRLIDWERVTPVEEIAAGNWRNWAKRTLRRWR